MTLLKSQEEKRKVWISQMLQETSSQRISWIVNATHWCIGIPEILGLKWSSALRCSLSLYINYRLIIQATEVLHHYFSFLFLYIYFLFCGFPFITLIKLISQVHLLTCVISLSSITGHDKKKVRKGMSEEYWYSMIRHQCFHKGKEK